MKNLCSWRMTRWLFICCFLLLVDVGLMAQSLREVHGKVVDAVSKEPLIGVSIAEKGGTGGSITQST